LQEEAGEAAAEGDEGSDNQGQAAGKAVKHVVRNPQPKLNIDRLTSAKGIPVLVEMTKEIKFKGKGHEANLDAVLGVLDHWAHRTFPRFHSEFFYQRLESLGKKRQTQHYLKRMAASLEKKVTLARVIRQHASERPDSTPCEEHACQDPTGTQSEKLNTKRRRSMSRTSGLPNEAPPPRRTEPSPEVLREIEEKRRQALEKRRQRLSQLQASTGSASPSQPGASQNTLSPSSPSHSPSQTDPSNVELSQADTSQPGLRQAAADQAGFSQASCSHTDPSQADLSRGGPSQANCSHTGSDEGGVSQVVSSQSSLVQAGSSQAASSQAASSQAASSQPASSQPASSHANQVQAASLSPAGHSPVGSQPSP
ncbi:unnamed protein product, partial [Ixodes hexagonus]